MSYTIILGNGKVLQGVERDGMTWMTREELTRETFRGGLMSLKVEGPEPGEGEEDIRGEYGVQRLDALYRTGKWTSFVLTGVSPEERGLLKVQGDVEYIAMMMGVEL